MGVIQRQSIKYSVVQYVGIAIGAISTVAIYPRALDVYGLVQALISAAGVAGPLVILGTTGVIVKFFPFFRDESRSHNGFLGVILLVVLGGFLVFVLCFSWLREALIRFFEISGKPGWYSEFLPYVVPLVLFIVLARVFAIYSSNFQRIVVPVVLEDFLIKITLPVLILLFVYHNLSVHGVVTGVILNYVVATAGLLIYLYAMGQLYLKPSFSAFTPKLTKEMASFAGFGILNGMGTKTAFFIDTLMVSGMLDLTSTGIYGIGRFIGDTLSKPIRSIIGISQPIIAKAYKENNREEIEKIYKKSSLNLLILGVFLFVVIWACLDDLFKIMPNGDVVSQGKYVVFFLILANLTDMATSVNNEIINYSKYYKFNFVALIALSVFNVFSNLYFIPRLGIVGAAIATFISLALFNLVKMIYISARFKMLPFTSGTWIIFLTGIVMYLITWILPDTGFPLVNMALKIVLTSAIYPIAIYKLKVSEDYNELVYSAIKKYLPFLMFIFK